MPQRLSIIRPISGNRYKRKSEDYIWIPAQQRVIAAHTHTHTHSPPPDGFTCGFVTVAVRGFGYDSHSKRNINNKPSISLCKQTYALDHAIMGTPSIKIAITKENNCVHPKNKTIVNFSLYEPAKILGMQYSWRKSETRRQWSRSQVAAFLRTLPWIRMVDTPTVSIVERGGE